MGRGITSWSHSWLAGSFMSASLLGPADEIVQWQYYYGQGARVCIDMRLLPLKVDDNNIKYTHVYVCRIVDDTFISGFFISMLPGRDGSVARVIEPLPVTRYVRLVSIGKRHASL